MTAHNDVRRTGNQGCETVLTPRTAPFLRKIGQSLVDGTVTAQPLFLEGSATNLINNVAQDAIFVATNGSAATRTPKLYVVNPTTLVPIFQVSLYTNVSNPTMGTFVGVLSTPVIDKAANKIYIVDADANGGVPQYHIIVFDINSMNRLADTVIAGVCSSGEPFSAHDASNTVQQQQRPALLLDHGHVYVSFGSANNESPSASYNGWIFAYNTHQAGQTGLTSVGSPYCVSRAAGPNSFGRGGIWQMGAGISADSAGNVYAATGNGNISDPLRDDGQSYVQLAGATWTGALQAKYLNLDANNFLAPNELEGSSGPVVLPGPSGTQLLLGATKMGLFTLMNAAMAPVQTFRGAWHQYGPILGDPDPTKIEQDAVACNSPTGCDSRGIPSFQGTQSCCPSGCTNTLNCMQMIHGSHPHVHGQPCYLSNASGTGGSVFWWGEKDYPRYMTWSATQGTVVPVPGSSRAVDNALNRVSTDPSDAAPNNVPDPTGFGFMMGGMPGGMTSLSSNLVSNAVLWSNLPQDSGTSSGHFAPIDAWLSAFDVSGSLPKKHVLRLNVPSGEYHAYPTIAGGRVYLAGKGRVNVYGLLPTTVGVFRPPGTTNNQTPSDQWLLRYANAAGTADRKFSLGSDRDIPVVGDWTGSGAVTVGVFRPAGAPLNTCDNLGQWLLSNSNSGNTDFTFCYGAPGDVPIVGDWAASGTTTVGVFRPANTTLNATASGQWLLRNSNTAGGADLKFFYGAPDDMPIVGDWGGSGATTIGVVRPPNSQFNSSSSFLWLLRNSNSGGNPDSKFLYGTTPDIPVVGRWTGTGATTIGVFRPANSQFNETPSAQWLLRLSNSGGDADLNFFYGGTGDQPIVGAWAHL